MSTEFITATLAALQQLHDDSHSHKITQKLIDSCSLMLTVGLEKTFPVDTWMQLRAEVQFTGDVRFADTKVELLLINNLLSEHKLLLYYRAKNIPLQGRMYWLSLSPNGGTPLPAVATTTTRKRSHSNNDSSNDSVSAADGETKVQAKQIIVRRKPSHSLKKNSNNNSKSSNSNNIGLNNEAQSANQNGGPAASYNGYSSSSNSNIGVEQGKNLSEQMNQVLIQLQQIQQQHSTLQPKLHSSNTGSEQSYESDRDSYSSTDTNHSNKTPRATINSNSGIAAVAVSAAGTFVRVALTATCAVALFIIGS